MDQFFAKKLDKKSIQALTRDWHRRFQGHKENAVNELAKFFVKCCGVGIDETDIVNTDARGELVEQIEAEMQGKPEFVPDGITANDFHLNIIRFFTNLTEVCLPQVLIDPMFSHFYNLLIDLSDCRAQSVRFNATLASLKIATEIFTSCIEGHTAVKINSSHLTELREISRNLVQKVIAVRYKDGSWRVRLLVMKELAIWFDEYLDHIAPEVLIRYIADNLSDSAAAVRLECSIILNDFVSRINEDSMPDYLHAIIENKKRVLLNMAFENNYRLSCAAITLLTNIMTLCSNLFDVADHKKIMWNIYDPNPNIARQAAKFFVATFPSQVDGTIEKIRFLITYFESFAFHPEILGTIMYGEFEAFSNFGSIANFLMETDNNDEALKFFKLGTYSALALSKQDSAPGVQKRKKRKVGNVDSDKSNFLRAFSNCHETLSEKYALLDDEWTFTFEIFYKVYDMIYENELPLPDV